VRLLSLKTCMPFVRRVANSFGLFARTSGRLNDMWTLNSASMQWTYAGGSQGADNAGKYGEGVPFMLWGECRDPAGGSVDGVGDAESCSADSADNSWVVSWPGARCEQYTMWTMLPCCPTVLKDCVPHVQVSLSRVADPERRNVRIRWFRCGRSFARFSSRGAERFVAAGTRRKLDVAKWSVYKGLKRQVWNLRTSWAATQGCPQRVYESSFKLRRPRLALRCRGMDRRQWRRMAVRRGWIRPTKHRRFEAKRSFSISLQSNGATKQPVDVDGWNQRGKYTR
jgi:hypothetical protein